MNGGSVDSHCDRFCGCRRNDNRSNSSQSPSAKASFFARDHPLIWRSASIRLLTCWKRRLKDQPDRPARECKAAKAAVIMSGQPRFEVVRVASVDALVRASYHVGVEFQPVLLTPSPRSSFESLWTNGRDASFDYGLACLEMDL